MARLSVKNRTILLLCALLALAASGCGFNKVQVTDHQSIEVPVGKRTKNLGLTRMIVKVPRGSHIGNISMGVFCAHYGSVNWRSGRYGVSDDELSGIFYDELKGNGYNVVGNPDNLFESDMGKAEYLVGALVTAVTNDICYSQAGGVFGNWNNGKSSTSLTMEWQVYDARDKKILYKKTVTGSANVDFSGGNPNESIYAAFQNAIKALLSDKNFLAIVSLDQPEKGPRDDAGAGKEAIFLERVGGKGATRSLADVKKSVVTVQAGSGHGSGFVVSRDGLVVTNRHVVTDGEDVRLVTSDGRKVDGTVLRRDASRDVALISAPALNLPPLALRERPLEVGDEVFAVGSPRDINLAGTVTKGIFSSVREMSGETWLQSDAAINPGNSGGPLVDKSGAVAGISTLARTDSKGIYFFGPILDALNRLNVMVK